MPTTLDQLAQKIAPTPSASNYFDPVPGQSVMTRYANAGRQVADSELAAEAGSRLNQSRESRLATRSRRIALDRDEEEFKEKQDFKIGRGRFLEQIASISPEAEDFEDQLSELFVTLPPAAMKDDAVTDLLQAKRATATDLRNERQAQARRDEEQKNRRELMEIRYSKDHRLAALTPEERASFYGADGEFDSVGAAMMAYQKTREDKKTDQVEVAKQKQALKVENTPDKDLDGGLRTLKALAKEHTEGDATAFPDQVEVIRQRLRAAKPTTFKEEDLKKDPAYADAIRYEKKKFVSELESARGIPEAEYVGKVAGLSAEGQRKRREVWQAANPDGAAAPAPAPAAAADKFTVGKRYRDANGVVKTYGGDGQWK